MLFLIIGVEQDFFLEQGLSEVNARRRCGHGVHNLGRGEQRRPFCFVLDGDPSICRKPREQWLFQGRAVAQEPAQGSLKDPLRITGPAGE